MTDKDYKIIKNRNGTWTFFHPTGLYSNQTSENLLRILIKFLNELSECKTDVEEEYLDFSIEMEKVKQENKQLKQRFDEILSELYCKDRKLEELNVSIECCDKDD